LLTCPITHLHGDPHLKFQTLDVEGNPPDGVANHDDFAERDDVFENNQSAGLEGLAEDVLYLFLGGCP